MARTYRRRSCHSRIASASSYAAVGKCETSSSTRVSLLLQAELVGIPIAYKLISVGICICLTFIASRNPFRRCFWRIGYPRN